MDCSRTEGSGYSQLLQPLEIEGLSISSVSFVDPRLQAALLPHPSFSQDQQVVAKLLQTSKELQAAVGQWGAGQLHLALQPRKLQQVECLAQWLQKHDHLLSSLDVELTRPASSHHTDICRTVGFSERYWAEAAVSALEQGMQAAQAAAAAAAGALQLQAFSLRGCATGAPLLLQLPAAHLTWLHVEVDISCRGSMWAVAALANLRHLELITRSPSYQHHRMGRCMPVGIEAFEPLAAACSLQQLTQLHVGPIRPTVLQWLQPLRLWLQQLHITADMDCALSDVPREVVALAQMLKQHACIVRSLTVVSVIALADDRLGESLWCKLVAALQEAATATAPMRQHLVVNLQEPASPAAATPAAVALPSAAAHADRVRQGLQLQLIALGASIPAESAGQLLQALPAGTLTQLQCPFTWSSKAQLKALSRLTALRSCDLTAQRWSAGRQPVGPITTLPSPKAGLGLFNKLQQLTQLRLEGVGAAAAAATPAAAGAACQLCRFLGADARFNFRAAAEPDALFSAAEAGNDRHHACTHRQPLAAQPSPASVAEKQPSR
jgi:hypothetical protein